MAAPMTPASPYRDPKIVAKENAIKSRLAESNNKNKQKAISGVAADLKAFNNRGRKGISTRHYTTQEILGADKGFSQSDYGVEKGAAIPYQIGSVKSEVSGSANGKGRNNINVGWAGAIKNTNSNTHSPIPGWARPAVDEHRKKAIARRAVKATSPWEGS